MVQIHDKDALRTREEVLLFFFFLKSATAAQVALKAACIYTHGQRAGTRALRLRPVTSQSLSPFVCTSGRTGKHASLFPVPRKLVNSYEALGIMVDFTSHQ